MSARMNDPLTLRILYALPTDGTSIHPKEIAAELRRTRVVHTEREIVVGLSQLISLDMCVCVAPDEFARADRRPIDMVSSAVFAELMAQIAATLIHNNQNDVDFQINEALRRIVDVTGTDRGYIFDYDFECNLAYYRYESCAEGVSAQIDVFPTVPLTELSHEGWIEPHKRGESVVIHDVANLENQTFRRWLICQDIQSIVAVPILCADQCVGFIGFDSVRQSRHYSNDEIRFLEMLAGMLSSLHRREVDRIALEQARNSLDTIVEGAGVGTWIYRMRSGSVQINEQWATMLGYAREELEPVSIDTWARLLHPDDLISAKKLIEQHMEGLIDYYDVLVRMRHKEGQWLWIQTRGRVVRRDPYEGPVAVGIHQDMTAQVLTQQALEQSEESFREFLENLSNVAVQGYNHDKEVVFWNRGSESLYGYSAAEAIGKNFADLIVFEDQREQLLADIDQWIAGGPGIPVGEMALHDKSGITKYVYSSHALQRTSSDEVRLYSIDVDLTAQKVTQQRMELLSRVFTHSYDGVVIADLTSHIIEVNDRFCEMTGYARDEVIGQTPAILHSGRQSQAFYEAMWRQLTTDGYWLGQIWNRKKSGQEYAVEMRITAIKDEQGAVVNYIANGTDITERLNYEDNLKRVAFFDELTGLANRRSFEETLRETIANGLQDDAILAVAFVDLDEFKSINDAHSHEIGDRYLQAIANRLVSTIEEADFVARFGGDEFVLILRGSSDTNFLEHVSERLESIMHEPIVLDGNAFRLTASLGVTLYPQNNEIDADQLIRQAGQAMYSAKQDGKNKIVFFDTAFERSMIDRNNRIEALRQAIDHDELVLHYQPQIDMSAGKVLGVEALVRWQHPTEGLLFPGSFLGLVQGNEDLGQSLTRWVLNQALNDLERITQCGHSIGMSVNIIVAANETVKRSFLEYLASLLQQHPNVDPKLLILEIVENILIEDLSQATEIIHEIQKLGFKISLDDFGTGFSSLSYLKHLSFDELKIDQGFVRDMLNDHEDMTIVQAVIGMAQAFNVPVIAEGVETEQHAEMLLHLGCTNAQGYAISRPLAFEVLITWLSSWKPDPIWHKIAPISKDVYPLIAMLSAHTGRITVLEQYLRREDVEPPAFDTQTGEFEKIAYLLDSDNSEFLSVRDKAIKYHTELCMLGTEAVIAFDADQLDDAQRKFEKAAKLSLKFYDLIWDFCRQGGQRRDDLRV